MAKAKPPTAEQKRYRERVRALGCLVCGQHATIHHLYTGAGGRKDHWKLAPLCWKHHLGREGIDGRMISKKKWQEKYISEHEMEAMVRVMLGEKSVDELIGNT